MRSRLWDGDRTITSPFGPRASGFHDGIDVSMPIGTNLYAPDNATVSNLKDQFGANYQSLRLTDGRQILLVHLNDFVASGQVSKGQLISHSGNTGQSTGPHTHVTLRAKFGIGSSAIDPTSYLQEGGEEMLNAAQVIDIYEQIRGLEPEQKDIDYWVGRSVWELVKTFIDSPYNLQKTKQLLIDTQAKQIANLQDQVRELAAEVEKLKATPPTAPQPPVDPIGADTRNLIQKIKDFITKYFLD